MSGRKRKIPNEFETNNLWEGDSSFEIDLDEFVPDTTRSVSLPNPQITSARVQQLKACNATHTSMPLVTHNSK